MLTEPELSVLSVLGRSALAALLGLAIGWERRAIGSPVRARIIALVAMTTTALTAMSLQLSVSDLSRVLAGLLTGIGFIGASAEGSLQGTFNEMLPLNGFAFLETPKFLRANIDKFGGPQAYNHYAVNWAHAMDTPYQWTKQIASHWGGTRNGTIVYRPGGIQARGQIRSQFCHVIDVAPTVLEAAGLPEPAFVNGIQQKPYEGMSMLYSFGDGQASERHTTQYFEIVGNRGIYHKGWTAVTKHRTPWETGAIKTTPFDDDIWELYDTNADWTQAHDLAHEMPDKLHEMQRLPARRLSQRYRVAGANGRPGPPLRPGKRSLPAGSPGRRRQRIPVNPQRRRPGDG